MKSRRRDLHETVYGAVVFRNDVEAMLTLMGDRGLAVKLTDREHEYSSLDEVEAQLGQRPPNLELEGRGSNGLDESVTVYFSGNHVSVLAGQQETVYVVGRLIADRLIKRRSMAYVVMTHPMTAPVAWVACLSSFALKHLPPAVELSLAATPIVALCADVMGRRHNCLSLSQHKERNFLTRRRDDILLAVIGAIVGAAVTLMVQRVTGR